MATPDSPHHNSPELRTGTPAESARLGIVLVHGRGGSARDMLGLADVLHTDGLHWLAPEARGNTWYPQRFLAPLEANEPALTSALQRIDTAVRSLHAAGLPDERIALIGFSQGACLSLEYAARAPRRFACIAGLSGALIGPDEPRRAPITGLEGTPVFLGCSDTDFHIPAHRVQRSAEELRAAGADVTLRLYPGAPHAILEDELDWLRAHLIP